MIVLPLFGDQYDNAQRMAELRTGGRLDPYGFTNAQMHDALGRLLANDALRERLASADGRSGSATASAGPPPSSRAPPGTDAPGS